MHPRPFPTAQAPFPRAATALLGQRRGATFVEYATLVALISTVVVGAVIGVAPSFLQSFSWTGIASHQDGGAQGPSPNTGNGGTGGIGAGNGGSGGTGNPGAAPSLPDLVVAAGHTHPTFGGLPPGQWVPLDPVTLPAGGTVSAQGETGRVRVLGGGDWAPTAVVPPGGTVEFEVFTPPLYGVEATWSFALGTSSASLSGTTRPEPDTTPDVIVVLPIETSAPGTLVTTSPTPITGLEDGFPTPISVAGEGTPLLSIDGGPWIDSGTILNGQSVQVSLTAPPQRGQTATATLTVGGGSAPISVSTPPPSTIAPFSFGSVSLAWNNSTWRLTSPYVDIVGLDGTAMPFAVTGDGTPHAQANVQGGPRATGMVLHGTDLQMDAPAPGGTHTATLTIDGTSGTFTATTAPIPNQEVWGSGPLWLWIPVHWQGRSFSISGGGAAGAAPDGNITATTTLPNGRIVGGTARNGFNLVIDAPATVGAFHTVSITINGSMSTFRVTRR